MTPTVKAEKKSWGSGFNPPGLCSIDAFSSYYRYLYLGKSCATWRQHKADCRSRNTIS